MSSGSIFHVKPQIAASARITASQHGVLSNHAAQEPDGFWLEEAGELDWFRKPTLASNSSFRDDVRISWFGDGQLNVSVNCLDRHLRARRNQPALIWQGEDEADSRTLTYAELLAEVCRLGNAMRAIGVGKGDRVAIYLPMVMEGAIAMLACARIGAVHVVMFAGLSPSSVADRIGNCGAKLLITADSGRRAGKRVPLKAAADVALANDLSASIEHVLVLRVTGEAVDMQDGRDLDYAELVSGQPEQCEPEVMGAEDPFMLLYTSGSTGKPKGVLHTTGGYLVWARFTHAAVFDYQAPEVFWCTADIGWVTGHSYTVYGPLANGGTSLLYEGTPSWPQPGRWWRIIDKYQVATLYTAPTAIRSLMREDPAALRASSRASLRILGTVGEPIGAEAWLWYHREVGGDRCPVIDTWWQTETGGIMIAPLPGAIAQKPGSATLPLPGVCPVLVDDKGQILAGEAEGQLCIDRSWPGQARTIWGDHARFVQTYFSTYPGLYFSGDGARRDADGYYWITGRVDDVVNVSGHRIGSAEVESAFGAHDEVAESAVIGVPHEIKGQALFAFVVLKSSQAARAGLEAELQRHVGTILGRYAAPDTVLIAPDLPKTRSGKIMRRILRKIATRDTAELGDTTTLADPSVVQVLIDRVEGRS